MKKLVLILVFGILLLGACGEGTEKPAIKPEKKETSSTQKEKKEKQEEEKVEDPVELTRQDELERLVTERVKDKYQSTSLQSITVNDDMGKGEGYIVLVTLSFDAKNRAKTVKDMIDMYGNDLPAYLAEQEDVNEVVTFWEVPYLKEGDNVAKIATKRSGAGMAITDEFYDSSVFN